MTTRRERGLGLDGPVCSEGAGSSAHWCQAIGVVPFGKAGLLAGGTRLLPLA